MNETTWTLTELDGKFQLNVQVDSTVRDDRTLLWEGQMKVTGQGHATLARMHLAGISGKGTDKGEQPGASGRVLRDLILDNTTNSGSPGEIIQKVVRACEQDTKRLETILADRASQEYEDRARAAETIREIRELTKQTPPGRNPNGLD